MSGTVDTENYALPGTSSTDLLKEAVSVHDRH